MKLQLELPQGYSIRSYERGTVTIGERRYAESLIVTPQRLIQPWQVPPFEALAIEHLAEVVELAPEILLLGSGERQRFPTPALAAALAAHGIGLEAMDTAAACRTYNILMGDGRRVAAALILD